MSPLAQEHASHMQLGMWMKPVNPLCAELLQGSLKICFYFIAFLDTKMAHVAEIFPCEKRGYLLYQIITIVADVLQDKDIGQQQP